jgi:hypothetical protein
VFAAYSDDTDPIRGGEVRGRELFAGALLPFRRIRWSQAVMGGYDADWQRARCDESCRPGARDLHSLRAGWWFDSRRLFPYSVSTEEGVAIDASVEASRTALGSDADATAIVAELRGFHRLFSPHTVVAVRAAAAYSTGDAAGRRVFSAAGSASSAPRFDFGRDAVGLIRGIPAEDVVGTRAAVLNVDLRVPLARPQRGAGTLPIFVRALHAAAFADAGSAWDGAFRSRDIRWSTGGELSLDAVAIYSLRFTLAGGAAWTHDPVAGRSRVAFFSRIGYAF